MNILCTSRENMPSDCSSTTAVSSHVEDFQKSGIAKTSESPPLRWAMAGSDSLYKLLR